MTGGMDYHRNLRWAEKKEETGKKEEEGKFREAEEQSEEFKVMEARRGNSSRSRE